MSNDHELAPCLGKHAGRNLTGERALLLPEKILPADCDVAALYCVDGRGYRCKRRRNDDIAVRCVRNARQDRREKRSCTRLRLVHLPIPCDHSATPSAARCDAHRLVSASTPGNLRPPRNSSDAPPPVEMCEIFPATPDCCTAATESPPPTIDVAPESVAFATAFAISSVPWANAGISNPPIGPFQTMVFAFAISAA